MLSSEVDQQATKSWEVTNVKHKDDIGYGLILSYIRID